MIMEKGADGSIETDGKAAGSYEEQEGRDVEDHLILCEAVNTHRLKRREGKMLYTGCCIDTSVTSHLHREKSEDEETKQPIPQNSLQMSKVDAQFNRKRGVKSGGGLEPSGKTGQECR